MEYKFEDLSTEQLQNIVGINDENINLLEDLYGCGIVYRDNYFKLLCDNQELFIKFSSHMDYLIQHSIDNVIDYDFIKQSFIDVNEKKINDDYKNEVILNSYNGKPYKCKTYNQYKFIKLVKNNDLVFFFFFFCTGKTFIVVLLVFPKQENL